MSFLYRVSCISAFTGLILLSSNFVAKAEVNSDQTPAVKPVATQLEVQPVAIPSEVIEPVEINVAANPSLDLDTQIEHHDQLTEPQASKQLEQPLSGRVTGTKSIVAQEAIQPQAPSAIKTEQDLATSLPPAQTTADALLATEQNQSDTIAQVPGPDEFPSPSEAVPTNVDPGRATRSGSSYIGVGGNLGVLGGTGVGNDSLMVYSKIGLTRYFSFRPSAVIDFNHDATFLLPLTLDFAPRRAFGIPGFRVAPYLGGGAAVSTTGRVGPLATAGFDVPITRNFTATAGVNVGFLDPIDLGVFLGVAYNFPNFF